MRSMFTDDLIRVCSLPTITSTIFFSHIKYDELRETQHHVLLRLRVFVHFLYVYVLWNDVFFIIRKCNAWVKKTGR
ncbi:hypothetical protein AR158_c642R [Paramecium bursaria Chlorella virus AR158]|uniref:hypothetical protein n=1 Tax=Paramecium bursaria Chlorella virus AR158 TaxID=380598 RepID=UPI00015AA801|nr:hypothetical protein AR158_c642R [Paramecium bursaria Chlorella virus AR158]ABU44187.1 hypothetical protein AR158_c642R [Paramecium bursaria Chlorella virus AR158]